MATVGSAIVCDYMETGLFAIVCDLRSAIRDRLRSSSIVCDHMETSLKFWHGVLQGEGPGVQIRHDPKNFRIFLHWKHCFCSAKDKEKSFSEKGLVRN